MILRSQNKDIVEVFNYVRYENQPCQINAHHFLRSDFYLAQYTSKEKAMKVLDDLHNDLIHGSKYFNFPKDEDVIL